MATAQQLERAAAAEWSANVTLWAPDVRPIAPTLFVSPVRKLVILLQAGWEPEFRVTRGEATQAEIQRDNARFEAEAADFERFHTLACQQQWQTMRCVCGTAAA